MISMDQINLCLQTNLGVDYDPSNITHHARHLCIDERHLYAPSYDLNPRLLDYTIPPEYVVSLGVTKNSCKCCRLSIRPSSNQMEVG